MRLAWPFAVRVLVVSLLVGLSAAPVRADEPYANLIPCRATAMNAAGMVRPCITCHTHPDGAGCASPPCLNAFGTAFETNGRVWNEALAMMDSDGDGYTNGEELGDPLGTWRPAMAFPGTCSCASRPAEATDTAADSDADMDGYCCRGRDLDDDGDCLGVGENDGSFDCDDSNATVFAGAFETCTDALDNDCDTLPDRLDMDCAAVFDGDGDGYCEIGADPNGDGDCTDLGEDDGSVDCDDMDPAVSPSAVEICTNVMDEDCDGLVALDDPDCAGFLDLDGDGYCAMGADDNDDGDCVDSGEERAERDCDDTNAAISPAADEVCDDTVDNDCDGGPDRRDPECPCDSSAQCDDGDPCTSDVCASMACT